MAAIKLAVIVGAAVLSLPALCVVASAEDYAATQAYMHSFNNGVTVYSGVFALNKDLNLQTSTYFKYNIDLINPSFGEGGEGGGGDSVNKGGNQTLRGNSSRGVAAASGASSAVSSGGNSAKDTRHAFTAGLKHEFKDVVGVEAYYDYSKEKDYTSHTPTFTLKKDLFNKNTTITAAYSKNNDRVKGVFMDGAKGRNTDNYFAGVTQALTPYTLVQAGYSRNNSNGYESEGIRLVPLSGTPSSSCTAKSASCREESFPSKRFRNAYILGVSQYFNYDGSYAFNRSAVRLTLRYYDDSWGVNSYMSEVEYNKYLSEQVVMRLNYRYYTQDKAYFALDNYDGPEQYKSSSPQLLKFDSRLAGVKLGYKFKDTGKGAGSFPIGVSIAEAKYEYYTQSIGVNAHVVMAALRLFF
ncbi:MAG: DUF3570 domain-containing protein [Deltaproteobacteria bacterium]|nr:DUF3570 domain-containing protein [Deltaproteobacteria bacterium]